MTGLIMPITMRINPRLSGVSCLTEPRGKRSEGFQTRSAIKSRGRYSTEYVGFARLIHRFQFVGHWAHSSARVCELSLSVIGMACKLARFVRAAGWLSVRSVILDCARVYGYLIQRRTRQRFMLNLRPRSLQKNPFISSLAYLRASDVSDSSSQFAHAFWSTSA